MGQCYYQTSQARQIESPAPSICYLFRVCWPGKSHIPLPKTGDYFQCFCHPLKTDSMSLLMNAPHTSVIEHGEMKLVLTWKPHPHGQLSQCWKVLSTVTKEKCNHKSHLPVNPVSYNNGQPVKTNPLEQYRSTTII